MRDVHGYENETDEGLVPGLATERQAECTRRNKGQLMLELERTDPRTETLAKSQSPGVVNLTRAAEPLRRHLAEMSTFLISALAI